MSASTADPPCAFCDRPATVAMDPPRRTFARGADPDDPSFSITVILPDVPLCPDHAEELFHDRSLLGWCDGEPCRAYGKRDTASPCGAPFLGVEPKNSHGAKRTSTSQATDNASKRK